MYKYLYVWYNPNHDIYYYKLLNHSNSEYYVGYVNQYNHSIVLIDKIIIEKRSLNYVSYIKKKAMRNIITYLERNI